MNKFKRHWFRLPRSARRPLVFIVGTLLILLSALIGWLPGPGGMVIFLLGIAVLSTEFTWAERLRNWLMERFKNMRDYLRQEPVKGWGAIIVTILVLWLFAYGFYSYII